jgi:hypothetical protein
MNLGNHDFEASSSDENAGSDPLRRAVFRRIAEGHQSTSGWSLSRAVWRAGELRLREAEPHLIRLIGTGDAMLDYSITWSLGQCGGERSFAALRQLSRNDKTSSTVLRLATDAMLQCAPAIERPRLIDVWIDDLPAALQGLARTGPADKFRQALREYLDGADQIAASVLEFIYLIDNQHVRPALLDALRTLALEPPFFQRIRHIFKSAEMRRDAEVFGAIARRFETTFSAFRTDWRYKPTSAADVQKAFGSQTRLYLRRRVWRTLKRLGEVGDDDYVRMAAGVLLAFTDDDALPVRSERSYDWKSRSWIDIYSDRFGAYWALNQILYRHSPRYHATAKLTFCCGRSYQPGGPEPAGREEAFPELWNRNPAALLQLLGASRCDVVHRFAVKALRTCDEFCRSLDIDALKMLLRAPYEVTVELGVELAVRRYDAAKPDFDLVLALADCAVERGRRQALQWIAAQPAQFFADNDFAVTLATSPQADVRAFARDALRGVALNEARAQVLVGRLIAFLHSIGANDDRDRVRDVCETLSQIFANQLRRIGADVIRDLVLHPLAEVQMFAGDVLLAHESLSKRPPDDVLEALLAADEASVRGIGVKIVGGLPDDVLKRSASLLVALTRHARADVRDAIRPTVQRLIAYDSPLARRLSELLIEAILTPGAPEGVPSHTARVLREDFGDKLAWVPHDTVWRLLQSRSGPAQEIGGLLLASNVRPDALEIDQIVRLASHDILSVREASWKIFRGSVARMRGEMVSAVRLLDAKWDDSRQFAFDFFREHFTAGEMTPELLVSICDSVQPDVQEFGREMITRCFQDEHGQEYLLKLSEHPAAPLQRFATNYLDRYAADDVERLRELTPFFVSVLSRVNKGRVAKDRVLALLGREALKSEQAAREVAEILTRISATCAIGDKAAAIEAMLDIHEAFSDVPLPITVQPVEVR